MIESWTVIRHKETDTIVAKVGNLRLSDEIADNEDFEVKSVKESDSIAEYEIDRSKLSSEEVDLINKVQIVP